jgi:cell division septum initiation protein DivIVA
MAWVVKAFKPEVLAAAERESRGVLREAERESRRVLRKAEREARDVSAHLLVLEDLGAELREHVRCRRRELPAAPPPPAEAPRPEPEPLPIPARALRPATAPTRPRQGRARMRDSPLAELFRPTAG